MNSLYYIYVLFIGRVIEPGNFLQLDVPTQKDFYSATTDSRAAMRLFQATGNIAFRPEVPQP